MAVVLHKKIENVRYIFGSPSTVNSRYNQIKRTFPEGKEYLVFTEPVYVEDTNSIIWSSERQGSIINYNKLSPTDQATAQKLLTNSIQKILAAAKQYHTTELTDFIYQCIEIPSMDNIFLVRSNAGDSVVITQWGFVSDVPGMEKGLLAKIINVKRVDMVFNVVYDDDVKEAAPNQKIYFEFEGQTQAHVSDSEGKITLNEVRVDEEVKVYRKDGETIVNEQTFTCYEGGKYIIEVPRLINMPFTVLNQHDVPVAAQTFTFEYEGKQTPLTSDASGNIVLSNIKINSDVYAYQTKETQKIHEHRYVCHKDEKYILKIFVEEVVTPPPPKEEKFDMKFKVIDPKGNSVPNAKVTIKYDGKTVEKITDDEGYTILEQVSPKTRVEVIAFADNKK